MYGCCCDDEKDKCIMLKFTTIPVEGLRSSSMMKRYLRAKKVTRVEGINK